MLTPISWRLPMRIGAALLFATGAIALGGCDQLLGVAPWDGSIGGGGSTSSAGGAGGSGGGGIGGGCPDGGLCVAIPLSWKGPAALTKPGGSCGGAFAEEVARGKTDVAGEPAVCGCTCKPPHDEVCASATFGVYTDNGCATGSTTQIGAVCVSNLMGDLANANSISVVAGPPIGGACDHQGSVEVTPPTFDERSLCEPEPMRGPCSAGICAPVPRGDLVSSLCVWVDGRADACPGDFTEHFDLYRGDVDDGRGCAGCSCGPPMNGSCAATAVAYHDAGCTSFKNEVTSAQGCVVLAGPGLSSVSAVYSLTAGACQPTTAKPSGSVAGTDPVTVCCTNAL